VPRWRSSCSVWDLAVILRHSKARRVSAPETSRVGTRPTGTFATELLRRLHNFSLWWRNNLRTWRRNYLRHGGPRHTLEHLA